MAKASLAALCIALMPIQPSRAQETWSFDIGGRLRERFESVDNPQFGLAQLEQGDYLLHRMLLSADVRYRKDVRALVEIVSGLTNWAEAPATQNDSLDVLQAYLDKSLPAADGQLTLRIGRQELQLGASRLVSVRESPNIRRAFDGVSASWTQGENRSVTAFFLRPVFPQSGVFDDRSSSEQRFSGIYATRHAADVESLGIDVYYLRLNRARAVFAQYETRELRHTAGMRSFGERNRWDWNVEGAWQWGSFGNSSIRAWTLSLDVGFELAQLPLSPRIGLKADAISGDRNLHDRQLETFNPLFPRLPYFSEANLATPANLVDAQPNVRLSLTKQLNATLSWNRLWKHQAADAFYAPPLSPVAGTSDTRSRDIGWQASALLEWRATAQLEIAATYVMFEPHAAIRQAGGRAGSFLAAWIGWTF